MRRRPVSGSALLAATPDVHVRIEKNPLRIAFLDKADRVISEDAPGRPLSLGPRGFRVEKHSMPVLGEERGKPRERLGNGGTRVAPDQRNRREGPGGSAHGSD